MFHTDMTTNSSTHYDFSAKFLSTKDHNNVTVKLVKDDDDNVFYFTDVIKLKAYEPYVFYKSDMPGIDMNNVKLVLDFGGNEAGTNVTVSRIDLQEHGCDGIVAPAEDEDHTENSRRRPWHIRLYDPILLRAGMVANSRSCDDFQRRNFLVCAATGHL